MAAGIVPTVLMRTVVKCVETQDNYNVSYSNIRVNASPVTIRLGRSRWTLYDVGLCEQAIIKVTDNTYLPTFLPNKLGQSNIQTDVSTKTRSFWLKNLYLVLFTKGFVFDLPTFRLNCRSVCVCVREEERESIAILSDPSSVMFYT